MRLLGARERIPCVLASILLLAGLARPAGAGAQGWAPAAAGGALGLLGGAVVSTGIVTLQSRHGIYLASADDALGWESAPIPVGLVAGLLLGARDARRGRGALVGGLVGGAGGTGIGALIGSHRWQDPERRWAGGVIGGAAGLLVGAVAGALLHDASGEQGATSLQIRLPAPR